MPVHLQRVLAQLEGEPLPLEHADAVLAGQGAAQFQRGPEHLVRRSPDAAGTSLSASPRSKTNTGCRLPSPACATVGDGRRAGRDPLDRSNISGSRDRGTHTSSIRHRARALDRGVRQPRMSSSCATSASLVRDRHHGGPPSRCSIRMILGPADRVRRRRPGACSIAWGFAEADVPPLVDGPSVARSSSSSRLGRAGAHDRPHRLGRRAGAGKLGGHRRPAVRTPGAAAASRR